MIADLPRSHLDENGAYFDDPYLIEHAAELDAVWEDWKSR